MKSSVNVSLGDVANYQTGFPFRSKNYSAQGVKLLRGDNIAQGSIRWDGAKFWPEEAESSADKFSLEAGDVVLAMDRPWIEAGLKYAAVSQEDLPCLLVQRVARLRGTDRIDGGYLRYLIGSSDFIDHILNITTGTAVPHISGKDILSFRFELPSLATQREIAATLGALDDKIELNRKTAATLEEMARALYRSWFVDFDPVHARAEGRAPAHMEAATAALFPDDLGADGLPAGWRSGVLADLIDFNPKERLPKGSIAPYFDMKTLPTSGMTTESPIQREFSSGTKFRSMDTLLARITPCLENGKTGMIEGIDAGVVAWGSTEFIVMRAKEGFASALPYCVARDPSFRDAAIATMTGSSGRQRADADAIAALPAAVPPLQVLRAFADLTDPLLSRIHAAGRESRSLAALRDSLLPRLMSGELRVGAAREMIEDAA